MSASKMIFIVTGSSGVGKTTLAEQALTEYPDQLERTRTYTTREIRNGEKDGEDYHFISPPEFKRRIEKGFFLEYAEVYGKFYGSGRLDVEKLRANGRHVLFNVDVQGAKTISEYYNSHAVVIGVEPTNINVLKERLEKRGDKILSIASRLQKAPNEIFEARRILSHMVINDERERARREFLAIFGMYGLKKSV